MQPANLDDLPVAEIMSRWPATIGVFLKFRLHCVGCPIGAFNTLADAAAEHECSLAQLRTAVIGRIAEAEGQESGGAGEPVGEP